MTDDEKLMENITRTFKFAKLAAWDVKHAGDRLMEISAERIAEEKKPLYTVDEEVLREAGLAPLGKKPQDPVVLARLFAKEKALRIAIPELEHKRAVARGDFRAAVTAAIRADFNDACDDYEFRASALISEWEKLVALGRWLGDEGGGNPLPKDFATSARIPSTSARKGLYLDGRQTRMFRCETDEVLVSDEARAIFYGSWESLSADDPREEEPNQPNSKGVIGR